MRKQYDYYEITPFKYEIVLYHDGIKVVTEKIQESYVLEFLKDSDIILTTWGSPRISDKMLEVCPNLIALVHAAGSVKGVVNEKFESLGIRVTSAAKELSRGVAETALGAAIAACKGLFSLSQQTRNGLWRDNYDIITDFYGIKVGVISAGMAGRAFIHL